MNNKKKPILKPEYVPYTDVIEMIEEINTALGRPINYNIEEYYLKNKSNKNKSKTRNTTNKISK
jgi:hypothetical protein